MYERCRSAGQLLPLEPQLVRSSAEKRNRGDEKGKEEEVWEKEEEETLSGINEEIPVPTERFWEHGERGRKGSEMTGRGAASRTRQQLLRKAAWSC